jgi:hypothetical protein
VASTTPANYSGTLNANGGALSGTQSWQVRRQRQPHVHYRVGAGAEGR